MRELVIQLPSELLLLPFSRSGKLLMVVPRRFDPLLPQPLLRVITVNSVVVRSVVGVVVGVVDVGVVIVVDTVLLPLVIGKICNRPFKSKTVKSGIMCVVLVASPFNGIQIEQPICDTFAPCM